MKEEIQPIDLNQLYEHLMGIEDETELVLKAMSGVSIHELKTEIYSPLVERVKSDSRFILDPIPNLYLPETPLPVWEEA